MIVAALVVLISILIVGRTHVAEGKPALKTIATVVVHAHHAHR
jgi:hypothetical protein